MSILDEDEVLDPAALVAIHALQQPGQPNVLRLILGLYRETAPALMEQIRLALDTGAGDEIRLAAHTLKSSSANLGARRFVALCRELEELGRDGKLDAARSRFDMAELEFTRLLATLVDIDVPRETIQ